MNASIDKIGPSQPSVTGKRRTELPETTAVIDRSVRPCLSWTDVADKAHVPLQALVEHYVITPQDRQAFLWELIPKTTNEQMADGGNAWASRTIYKLIQRVSQLAKASGLELKPAILQKRDYCFADLPMVSEQLVKVYQECVRGAFSQATSQDSPALCQLLEVKDQTFLSRLHDFFSERPCFLADPEFRNNLRQLVETHWSWCLKAIRPLPLLLKELDAGQALLRQIAPETLKVCVAICSNKTPVVLEAAECAALAEISESFQETFRCNQIDLPIQPVDLLTLCACYLRGQEPSFEQLGSLLIVSDRFPVTGLLQQCLEWISTCDKRAKSEMEIVESVCLLEKQLKNKLLPTTYETWSIARDALISRLLSRHPDPKLMWRIADFQQGANYWPVSLELSAVPENLPLVALEHLTISAPKGWLTAKLGNEIGKLSRLRTLKIDLATGFSNDGWSFLSSLRHLRVLNVIINSKSDAGFRLQIECELSQLEELAICLQWWIIQLPEISSMNALQRLKIENTRIGDCAKYLSHPSLKTLQIDKSKFDSHGGEFSIKANIPQSTMEVELSHKAKSRYKMMKFPEIPEALIARFKETFPTIKKFAFRIKGTEGPPAIWQREK